MVDIASYMDGIRITRAASPGGHRPRRAQTCESRSRFCRICGRMARERRFNIGLRVAMLGLAAAACGRIAYDPVTADAGPGDAGATVDQSPVDTGPGVDAAGNDVPDTAPQACPM